MDVPNTSWRYTVCIYNVRLGISMGYSIYMGVLIEVQVLHNEKCFCWSSCPKTKIYGIFGCTYQCKVSSEYIGVLLNYQNLFL